MKNSPPDPSRRPRVNVSPYQGPPPEQRRYLGTLGLAPSGHTIERKPHPGGWAGVVHSLGKVQAMAQEGMTHPTVRAWAIEKLKAGGNPRDNVGRAKVILEAIRKEKIWVPDPVNTEMMQGAHLTLGGVFSGGDCDDLSIAMLAAYLASCNTVGAQAAVVGHSYTDDREVTHVLGAVLDGKTWHYVEPSTDKVEFGDAYAPTREVVLWVPGDGTIACDADRCLTGSNTRMPRGASATFVGISGVGVGGGVAGFGGLGAADETALQESGDPSIFAPPSVLNKETSAGVGAWIFGLLEGVVARRDELLRSWQALQEIVDEQSVFSQSEGWTEEDIQRTRKLVIVGDYFTRALNEILEGKRQLFFGKNDNAFAMGHGPDDLDVQIDVAARTVEVKARNPSVFTNGLGNPAAAPAAAAAAPVAAAPVAVPVFITVALVGLALIALVYGWASVAEWQAHRAQEETRRRIAELYQKCLTSPDCTPEQRERIGAAFGKAAQGLQPAGAPPIGGGAAGGGSGYGWSWLGWPLLIGVAALAFTGASREYVRLANRSRRIRRRDERERSERSRAARTRVVRGEKFVGVDPGTGQPLVTTVDDDTESSLIGSFARALLS